MESIPIGTTCRIKSIPEMMNCLVSQFGDGNFGKIEGEGIGRRSAPRFIKSMVKLCGRHITIKSVMLGGHGLAPGSGVFEDTKNYRVEGYSNFLFCRWMLEEVKDEG